MIHTAGSGFSLLLILLLDIMYWDTASSRTMRLLCEKLVGGTTEVQKPWFLLPYNCNRRSRFVIAINIVVRHYVLQSSVIMYHETAVFTLHLPVATHLTMESGC